MKSEQVKESLRQSKIVAIFRKVSYDDAMSIAEAIVAAGVRTIEVTMDGADASKIIRSLKNTLNKDVLVGAGTVMSREQGENALSAGADVLFSPHLDTQLVEHFLNLGITLIPGVTTPTEMVTASRAGASILKLFPAASLGPAYLKDVLGPLAGTSFIPTGGITNENAPLFLKSGALAVGMGSSLVPKDEVAKGNWAAIQERVRALLGSLA